MNNSLTAIVNQQLEEAASGFAILSALFLRPRRLLIREEANGDFNPVDADAPTLSTQSTRAAFEEIARDKNIDLRLNENHFLVRTLSLPSGAKPYLDGIVRSQIDRLMPWKAEDTVFGWSMMEDTAQGLLLYVAATQKSKLESLLSFFKDIPVKSFSCHVVVRHEGKTQTVPLPVLPIAFPSRPTSSTILRRVLVSALSATLICQAASLAAQSVLDADLAAIQTETARLRAQELEAKKPLSNETDPIIAFAERKINQAPLVEVLNELARIFPDHTYLTATSIENQTIHIEGVSTDVTTLPALIDGSTFFTKATFSAATTRQRSGTGEHFRIDATLTARGASTP